MRQRSKHFVSNSRLLITHLGPEWAAKLDKGVSRATFWAALVGGQTWAILRIVRHGRAVFLVFGGRAVG